jgi:acyl-CoA reductase-like NAD-dependent aldehyde dehydrogenase
MLHIPILRKGELYKSLDVVRTLDSRTREPFVEISQANSGLIRRDMLDQATARTALQRFRTDELLNICSRAAQHFLEDTLPIGDVDQTPEDYIRQLSATTGLPYSLGRKNMQRIHGVMTSMANVLGGLTRGIDFSILDSGAGESGGYALSFFPRGDSLGVILPSNSPGVHALWIPAVPLKVPLILKPGAAEPWTPFRIIQAFIRAGAPREAFSYYPTDHAGAGEILRRAGRGIVFGDASTTQAWKSDPRIEIHGPGHSKIVIGDDLVDRWEDYLDVIVSSVADNGGRSCVNASSIWVTRHGDEIAEALAERVSKIAPRAVDDPNAQLAPFVDPQVAKRISRMIDEALSSEPGARDVTASYRGRDRLVEFENGTYLLPTVLRCESLVHPMANREFLFPFASVVEVSADEIPEALGTSLVVTAITEDENLIERLLSSPLVDRLNVGPISTMQIAWDQPHEGNLFEHLYARRAFQRARQTVNSE